jgi:hypothetical protein
MTNEITWKEANQYFSKIFMNLSIITFIIQVLVFLFIEPKIALNILFVLFSLCPILAIILTERHLSQVYDEDGKLKSDNYGSR